jgi:hypothetical protein
MRNIRIAAIVAALAASASFGTAAQAAATATGTATAEVLTTLTLTATRSLDFGQIAVNGAGTLTVATAGSTCSALLICTGSPTTATFDVTGSADSAYVATVPAGSVTLTSGGNTMTVDNFTANYPAGTTLVAGASSFEVGGRLNVGAAQPAGVYSGTFSVSVEYQ